jgi:hypothetical protein
MTFQQELDVLRAALVPAGDSKVVALRMQAGDHYLTAEFVAAAIFAFEHRAQCCLALGERLNPLEQLGVIVLRSAAGLPSIQ